MRKPRLDSAAYLKDMVRLDKDSPSGLVWSKGRRNGKKAGVKSGKYWQLKSKKFTCLAHRLVYELLTGETLGVDDVIDHLDGDGLNNDPTNIRKTTKAGNARNCSLSVANPSGYTGVYMHRPRDTGTFYWVAVWYEPTDGKQRRKYFSVAKYGDEIARKLAVKHRRQAIKDLTARGFVYSDRHGT